MAVITYRGTAYSVPPDLSVLETLESAGVAISSSCRNGACHTCKKKVVAGKLPPQAQTNLKLTEQEAGYFLPCVCYPTENITVMDLEQAPRYEVSILSVSYLNHEIIEIKLSHPLGFTYKPGQYIQVFKSLHESRTYSLASVPAKQEPLTLQVKLIPGGLVSQWLRHLTRGDKIYITGPFGDCFYTTINKRQPIIMIGTGSGLSPLYGILYDALIHNHEGDIYLFHGVAEKHQLYHESQLRELSNEFPNFHYFPALSNETLESYEHGMVLDVALKKIPNIKGSRVFLCGHPEMVKTARRKMFIAGVAMSDIFADPFA